MIEQLAGQMSIADLGISCGKTYPEHIPATVATTSAASSKRSVKSQTPKFQFLDLTKASGNMLGLSWETGIPSHGVPSTPSIGESPSVAVASTLSQILQVNVPEKYYLSKTACEGILRRAERRGKALPQMLKEALEEVVSLSSSKSEQDALGGGKGILCDVGKTFTLSTMLDQSVCVESGVRCLNPWDSRTIRQYDPSGVWPALIANTGGGQFRAGVVAAFKGGQGAAARTIGYDEGVTPTLNATPSGSNQVPDVVYALQANGIDRADTAGCNGAGWREDQCYTLNTIDRHAVCFSNRPFNAGDTSDVVKTLCAQEASKQPGITVYYDARGNGDGCTAPTITGDHNNRVTDYTALCVGNGQMCNITMAPVSNTLDCMHDQQAVLTPANPPRKYIVRRLTPVECARLQGFPDWWCMGLETPEPTEEDIAWAAEVWERWRKITSPNTKPKSRNQLIKWLKDPYSDAAEYKLWGNGIALPCAVRVMEGIVKEEHHEPDD